MVLSLSVLSVLSCCFLSSSISHPVHAFKYEHGLVAYHLCLVTAVHLSLLLLCWGYLPHVVEREGSWFGWFKACEWCVAAEVAPPLGDTNDEGDESCVCYGYSELKYWPIGIQQHQY